VERPALNEADQLLTASETGSPTPQVHRPADLPTLPGCWFEAIALVLWLLCTAAWRPLFLPDEARHVGLAYEMLRAQADGFTLWPTLNSLELPGDSPLLLALEIAAMRLFGPNEWAARCGPALLAWALGVAVFLHARHCFGLKVARLTLVVLATCPGYFVAAQFVSTDIGVAACITAAVLAFVRSAVWTSSVRRARIAPRLSQAGDIQVAVAARAAATVEVDQAVDSIAIRSNTGTPAASCAPLWNMACICTQQVHPGGVAIEGRPATIPARTG